MAEKDKKKYTVPEVEYVKFDYKDVALASISGQGDTDNDDDYDTRGEQ